MSATNGNRLIRPDQPQIGHVASNGPASLVQPVSVQAQQPGGVVFLTSGGLTKLEHAAIELAKHSDQPAMEIVKRAGQLIGLCDELQKAAQKQTQNIQE